MKMTEKGKVRILVQSWIRFIMKKSEADKYSICSNNMVPAVYVQD